MATAIGVGLGVLVGFVAVRGSGARRGGEAGEAFGFGGLGVEGEQAGEDVVRPVVGGKHCPSLFFDLVGSCLQLSKDQISLSKDALRDGGNKSSATVPQIWDLILRDPDVKRGTLVVSLAFGPGLTAAAMVARVV